MTVMHYIAEEAEGVCPPKITTKCGIVAWEEKHPRGEYSTALGDRIDATFIKRRVTCKRCLKSR